MSIYRYHYYHGYRLADRRYVSVDVFDCPGRVKYPNGNPSASPAYTCSFFDMSRYDERIQNWNMSGYEFRIYRYDELTPELMHNIGRYAGVHVYHEGNEVLFADRHFVALHTGADPATGELKLPDATGVYDVFARTTVAESADTIPLSVKPFSTVLYYLGEPGAFEAATRGRP